ncbi:Alkali-sensitive linkage protein 1 [Colletotrichum sidae]|uniref:Alkali-sensitive linkage protein 1 n=1 Tax=Colletotrichum sidae TaxID=1347389 RepID=A0A4R8TI10_9PEZI|nr:Alkali-sensitive linkage protein 1 [Colletotrichum sidae]
MFAKQVLAAAASLALAGQVMGFNAHRHLHADKRAVEYDIVTEWVTITVDGDHVPASTPEAAANPVVEGQYSPKPLTTTSTSIFVVPTPVAPAALPTTTLVTSYAPKVQEAAPVASSSQAAAAVIHAAAVNNVASVPASSTQAATTTAAVTASNTVGKRGLAYNDASLVSSFMKGAPCPNCGWAYNWDSSSNGLSESLNFVPMLWGPVATHTDRWQKNADAAIAKGSDHILSFNECDLPAQCNLDAASAAAAHVKWVNPYSGKVKIGAPAITNSNIAGQGLDWLKAFVSACDTAGCAYDFCVTHWYSPSDAADTLFSHLKSVHDICGGKPVWLTEFAPIDDAGANSFVQTNVPKLDSLEYLDRYAYFMVKDGVLVSGNSPSTLGQSYAAAS